MNQTSPPSAEVLDMECRKAAMNTVRTRSAYIDARQEERIVRYQWAIATGTPVNPPKRGAETAAMQEAMRRMGLL